MKTNHHTLSKNALTSVELFYEINLVLFSETVLEPCWLNLIMIDLEIVYGIYVI